MHSGGQKYHERGSWLLSIKGLLSVILCLINLKSTTMKVISESIRNFWEGFVSFYTVIYKEVKKWK
jgi:hypothetical protein